MENKIKLTTPRYQQIATDIASKIAEGHYKVGDKIYARSSLASQYGVSSETARRAICVLDDLDIVDTTKGSGVIIKSYENAIKFIRQYDNLQTIDSLKKNIIESVNKQKKELDYFSNVLSDLVDKTDRFRSTNPFIPFEIEITAETPYLNKSAADINFWHNTAATIIAIKRNGNLLMSPGPYASFCENDVFYFIGDKDCLERVQKFLFLEK
ncbi:MULTISPECIES: GntR family transcriptional regulator [Clostridium]|uniref:GntR family transcriptional regulator n=1 Tax=Clostridium cibarium TaxID=2762247 RepID=A0ABR8PRM0_9CLOT|nr:MULTISPECIES: GntR family transcriptional regulator [Clostridium]MBD7910821.1 GntR family transcriptional regulator [Clostridium cibarium]